MASMIRISRRRPHCLNARGSSMHDRHAAWAEDGVKKHNGAKLNIVDAVLAVLGGIVPYL